MWGHPGKKLLFMGGEFAQLQEWNHDQSLDWHLLTEPNHRGMQSLIRDLNDVYRQIPALHEKDCDSSGFKWIVGDDRDNSVFVFARFGMHPEEVAIIICNFTPVPHADYRIGVPYAGYYREVINTDSEIYGGSNLGNLGGLAAQKIASHGEPFSLNLTVPPLASLILHRAQC
jgi:1,4-alpha-glucan branching enzyme